MISLEEMREIAKRYRDPTPVILGSHSALDAMAGVRNYGMRGLIYTTKARVQIYLREPRIGKPNEEIDSLPLTVKRDLLITEDIRDIVKKKGEWIEAILVLERYDDILKKENLDALIELE